MPYYPYKDNKSGYSIEIFRSINNRDLPPTDDELPEDERGKEREWQRLPPFNTIVTFKKWSLKGRMGKA